MVLQLRAHSRVTKQFGFVFRFDRDPCKIRPTANRYSAVLLTHIGVCKKSVGRQHIALWPVLWFIFNVRYALRLHCELWLSRSHIAVYVVPTYFVRRVFPSRHQQLNRRRMPPILENGIAPSSHIGTMSMGMAETSCCRKVCFCIFKYPQQAYKFNCCGERGERDERQNKSQKPIPAEHMPMPRTFVIFAANKGNYGMPHALHCTALCIVLFAHLSMRSIFDFSFYFRIFFMLASISCRSVQWRPRMCQWTGVHTRSAAQ